MATNKVQLEVSIKGTDSVGKAAEKTTSLKTELKKLKAELASGNLTGRAFEEAAAKAGELQDRIGDVNEKVKNLASDTGKLDGFLDLATGITGGFAAAQGAMALFGSENEDLQKQLIKVQGAVALLNGVQQVANTLNKTSAAMTQIQAVRLKVLTATQAAYTFVVGASTGAMKLFRIALAATGIGALVVGLGLLVANFGKVKDVVMSVVDRFKNLGTGAKTLISVLFPIVGIVRLVYAGLEKMGVFTETAADKYDKLEKTTIKQNKALEREIELMEAQGKSAREIFEAKARLIKSENDLLIAKSKVMELSEEELEKNKDLVHQMNILNANETKRQSEEEDKRQKDRDEASKKAAEKRKAEHDKKVEQEKKRAEEINKIINEENIKQRERDFTEQGKEIAELQRTAEEKLKVVKGNAKAEKLIRENLSKDIKAIEDNAEKERAKKIEELQIQRNVLGMTEREKEIFAINEKYRLEQEAFKGNAEALKILNDNLNIELNAKNKQYAEEDAQIQIEASQSLQDAKIGIANQTSELLGQLAGKNKAVAMTALAIEKGAAIADVIIKGIRERAGITAKYSLVPGGLALSQPELIASRIRTGLSVATIAATGISGAKQINGGGTSSGSTGSQAPRIGGVNTGNNQPQQQQEMKVFVTETDIRKTTRQVDGIYTQATIR
jgi:hypothetical protein